MYSTYIYAKTDFGHTQWCKHANSYKNSIDIDIRMCASFYCLFQCILFGKSFFICSYCCRDTHIFLAAASGLRWFSCCYFLLLLSVVCIAFLAVKVTVDRVTFLLVVTIYCWLWHVACLACDNKNMIMKTILNNTDNHIYPHRQPQFTTTHLQ